MPPKLERRVTLLSTTPDGGPADQSGGATMPRKSSVLHDLGRKAATNFKNSVLKLPPQTLAVLELPAHMRTRAQVIELVTHLSWLPPFSRLEKVQMRALCYALHVVNVAAGVPWYFGEPPEPTPFDEPMDDFMREELARPPASAQCKGLDPRLPLQAYVLVLSGAAQFRRSKTMRKLTEEELVEQCKALFEMIDSDGSGTIDADELIEALQNEGVEVSRYEVNQILRSFARSAASMRQEAAQELLDAQKNKVMSSSNLAGLDKPARADSGACVMEEEEEEEEEERGIDFPTFLDAMRHTNGNCDWMEEITQKNNLREQFEAIDEDGSGEVDQEELSKALKDLGYPISRDELLMYFVDEDAEEEGALKDGIDFESFNKIVKGIKEAANKDVQDMGVGDTLGSDALLEGNLMQGGTLRPSAPTKLLVLELSEYARVLSLGHDGQLHRKRECLRQMPVLHDMGAAATQRLALCSNVVCKRAGDIVCQEGRASDGFMFVILSGTVNVTKSVAADDTQLGMTQEQLQEWSLDPTLSFAAFRPHKTSTRPRGRPRVARAGVSRLMAGQLLGEAAAFDGSEFDFTATAATPLTLLSFHHADLEATAPPAVLARLTGEMGLRQSWHRQVSYLVLDSPTARAVAMKQTHALGWGAEEEEEEEEEDASFNLNSATTPRYPSPPYSPRGEDLPPSSPVPRISPPRTPRSPAPPATPRTPGRAPLNPGYHIDGLEGVDSPMSPAASTAAFADGMLQRPLLFSHHRFDAPSMAEVRSVGGVLRSAHHRLRPEQLCRETMMFVYDPPLSRGPRLRGPSLRKGGAGLASSWSTVSVPDGRVSATSSTGKGRRSAAESQPHEGGTSRSSSAAHSVRSKKPKKAKSRPVSRGTPEAVVAKSMAAGTMPGAMPSHVRAVPFKTASMLRHTHDGDWRCVEDTYMRRFAMPPLNVAQVTHDNLKRDLVSDPSWQPGTSPRLRRLMAEHVSLLIQQQRHTIRSSLPPRGPPPMPSRPPTTPRMRAAPPRRPPPALSSADDDSAAIMHVVTPPMPPSGLQERPPTGAPEPGRPQSRPLQCVTTPAVQIPTLPLWSLTLQPPITYLE